ncbi:hypothetical protein AX767_04945 [Variovorax sp. PAMC 28711]|nr:hypothetical protein AX767_04945 [Variovorax sp. PAMC 28711]
MALFPLAFCNLANRKKWARAGSLFMLVVALGLDLALYAATISQGVRFFQRELAAGWAWIGLWSVWQIAFLATACRAPARRPSE